MSGERVAKPLPPIPKTTPPSTPQIPACAAQLVKLINPGNPRPTEEDITKLNLYATQIGQTTCKACLENPKLNIFEEGACPAKSPTTSQVFINNLRKPENLAPRHRAVKILRGPPKPPFERHPIPVIDQQVRDLAKTKPNATLPETNHQEEEYEPTVWQDIGYA
jgi:hypothetical protein